jgi:hypothetical protein
MALLKHLPALLCFACAACASSDNLAHVEVWLRECRGAGPCEGSTPNEQFSAQAFVEPSVSRYAPRGLYMYFELARADGRRGLLELDVAADEAEPAKVQASYRELIDDKPSFEASDVRGEIDLPESQLSAAAGSCGCDDGSFALRFVDPGEDGSVGNEDDQVRELSFGRWGAEDQLCSRSLRVGSEKGLRVNVEQCPEITARPTTRPSPPSSSDSYPTAPSCWSNDCYVTPGIVVAPDAGGCGDGEYYEDTTDDDSSGCSDDSKSGSDSGGCEPSSDQDPDQTSRQASGCEGDTSDAPPANCAVSRLRKPTRHPPLASFFGTGLPVLLVCLRQLQRAARSLRRRR